ncbi:hypothetical protein HPB47_006502 [Ixodes persulcatus]|uniref:Uncharacterized protein n=1 Tax=Ixodes persulcatus TaxID=34615 RepID=A0AC60P9V2_IXOPE|nr:hypothetical protein HPB47_006502 [Ixodes persulcatus]
MTKGDVVVPRRLRKSGLVERPVANASISCETSLTPAALLEIKGGAPVETTGFSRARQGCRLPHDTCQAHAAANAAWATSSEIPLLTAPGPSQPRTRPAGTDAPLALACAARSVHDCGATGVLPTRVAQTWDTPGHLSIAYFAHEAVGTMPDEIRASLERRDLGGKLSLEPTCLRDGTEGKECEVAHLAPLSPQRSGQPGLLEKAAHVPPGRGAAMLTRAAGRLLKSVGGPFLPCPTDSRSGDAVSKRLLESGLLRGGRDSIKCVNEGQLTHVPGISDDPCITYLGHQVARSDMVKAGRLFAPTLCREHLHPLRATSGRQSTLVVTAASAMDLSIHPSARYLDDDPASSNSVVQCGRETCPLPRGCYFLQQAKGNKCCDVCKGCVYNGRVYSSSEEWTDPHDPCRRFLCQRGLRKSPMPSRKVRIEVVRG